MSINSTRMKQLLALAKTKAEELRKEKELSREQLHSQIEVSKDESNADTSVGNDVTVRPINHNITHIIDKYGNTITLNNEQVHFANLVVSGKSCCLIGAAGTGKTTASNAGILALEQSGRVGQLAQFGHKYLPSGTPGVVGIAFTRNAVNNLKDSMPGNMKNNCVTFHKLLEYAPTIEEVYDEQSGTYIEKKIFKPRRDANNLLDSSIRVIIVDEASMPSVELFKEVLDALGHEVQFIFLGDLNQLPPVFGTAILGYALLALPTVELTKVYRNAGPIITFAHRVGGCGGKSNNGVA